LISKLYRAFLDDGFFTSEEALSIIPNRFTCMNTIEHLLETRQIVKVRRGLYELIPLEQISKPKAATDKFLLARKIVSPYCLAYHTALEIHGVANSAFYNTVYVTSPRQFRNFAYDGVDFKWISRKQLTGSEIAIWTAARILVTYKERTIIDCIDRIDLAGGFEELYKSVLSMRNVRFPKLYEYAETADKKVLFHKLGFLLSLPRIRDAWSVDDDGLRKIRENLSSRIFYFNTSKGQGQLTREWNLIVPKGIQELVELA
jgi:predicted transcriptional regulator of viral defense system